MSERVDLEMKTAFLERTVETLDAVVREQGNALASLERRLALIEQRVKAMQGGGHDVGPHDVPPPHY
ncbi:MAG: hypothetical protein CMJ85_09505 [Planctomycetes bacterium]|jgi:uncharacterized coiled-coil protein SlyX|nr:hypothetical protein [Planctomycetota bacterium]MDP6424984.1 SlyX family protein [Planctomycetota bacterium]